MMPKNKSQQFYKRLVEKLAAMRFIDTKLYLNAIAKKNDGSPLSDDDVNRIKNVERGL